MVFNIVLHTPAWVWATLLLLVGLGLAQSLTRRVALRRVIVLPLAMMALSVHGTFSNFGPAAWSWVMWGGALLASGAWFATGALPAGTRYDAAPRQFHLPGSWVPLALMLTIFGIRYAVAVALALHPDWTRDVAVAALVSSIYGALSGVFVGRMVAMLRLARAGEPKQPGASAVAWG